ncbi:tetraacyldisaccharide 4'-kinase [Methylophaga nitratireducenticrescens]|uniref:Tetraacyldisaccharide 4'-kinase n=1 Tax=Methylophaga nitratireducenticrescens TaxID=754476 RepID=I1XMY1_METNJ|nr:tetraacyldisaccharide 4'-kinase [Methylophaga nitratireducenticrescens]AFI85750.1 tetraacyldisaccharide 4'-kinase [Methylophaga nitratireducenticrescens]AUZ85476.1 tetraacyldisaccharide 4'-kinase [Methylophaga nitratireducenticrescens]
MKTDWLINSWYRPSLVSLFLRPVSWLYRLIISLRRQAYRNGLFEQLSLQVPVIVVGNISVGGSGKTPFVIWLTQYLQKQGWHPGIISRGYGGKADHYPCSVHLDSLAAEVGDEPLLIHQRTQCPVVVAPDRVAAGQQLLAENNCNVIISDDGLQHYRLQRDMEIVIIDAKRGLGNKLCLPAGPLREPMSRLETVDFTIYHGASESGLMPMHLHIQQAIPLASNIIHKPLTEFADTPIHAVAGIGHPQRFFDQLQQHGLTIIPHAFTDHHAYTEADFQFAEAYPILMTEKDAVKCHAFATQNMWYVPAEAELSPSLGPEIDKKLREL